jgi:hypothetical protein
MTDHPPVARQPSRSHMKHDLCQVTRFRVEDVGNCKVLGTAWNWALSLATLVSTPQAVLAWHPTHAAKVRAAARMHSAGNPLRTA